MINVIIECNECYSDELHVLHVTVLPCTAKKIYNEQRSNDITSADIIIIPMTIPTMLLLRVCTLRLLGVSRSLGVSSLLGIRYWRRCVRPWLGIRSGLTWVRGRLTRVASCLLGRIWLGLVRLWGSS